MTREIQLCGQLESLDIGGDDYAVQFVERLLDAARQAEASDVHVQPTEKGLDVRWRLDGVLQSVGSFPHGESADVVARLKVLAELLTYRTDVPQEGRIRETQRGTEMRVSTFPTLYGERAVVRLFSSQHDYQNLSDLGLPPAVAASLDRLLHQTSGALIVAGPAGSGKTTTAYACIRKLVHGTEGCKSVVSLEDPIEVVVEGVAQSQVNTNAGFDLAKGLRSLMRQDPEAILVGEIRDPEAAETVFQAALTGHVVITTFHAGSAAIAISRLSDMGIEPYLLRSGILGILAQRLVRRLCECKKPIDRAEDFLGLQVDQAWKATGCDTCRHTGYLGRMMIAEFLESDSSELGRAILSRSDSAELHKLATQHGLRPMHDLACEHVARGNTSPSEIRRVLGFVAPDR